MYEDFETVINGIIQCYHLTNEEWKQFRVQESYDKSKINLKRRLVTDLEHHDEIYELIWSYRKFLMSRCQMFMGLLSELSVQDMHISCRTKQQNSVVYKVHNYIQNHAGGKVPINKCLNDLFGIRIILHKSLENREIIRYINQRWPNLKCRDSSKDGYVAVHVYFHEDNYCFPWELQIWTQAMELGNLESHRRYKQDYSIWEKQRSWRGAFLW